MTVWGGRPVERLAAACRPWARRLTARQSRPEQSGVTYALNRRLERWMDVDGGVFIEAGANDGVFASNTLYFERHRGWTGLLVEPVPELAKKCLANRRARVALCSLGSPEQAGDITKLTYCNLMTIVDGAMGCKAADQEYLRIGRAVQTGEDPKPYTVYASVLTLSSLIDSFKLNHVDLLSLDVEGYERQALAGIDFKRHIPRFIIVDTQFNRGDIFSMLSGHYDPVEEFGHGDVLFRARGLT